MRCPSARFAGAPCRARRGRTMLIRPMQAQVMAKAMIGERRRLIGAVGADELQIGAEGRPVEQARHGELADDDGEGQERAARAPPTRTLGRITRNRIVGQLAPRLCAASVSVRTSIARRPVSTARYM